MSNGYLHELRRVWRGYAAKEGIDPYLLMVQQLGAVAQFKHIALDQEKVIGRQPLYHAQPYAVFAVGNMPRLIFTVLDLQKLRSSLNMLPDHLAKREIIVRNMTEQLDLAEHDYKAHSALIEQMTLVIPSLRRA